MLRYAAPLWISDAAGFVLALAVVTFLHLVIGEMAPKSLALARPERTATLLAIPTRIFMTFTRPVLTALNHAANWCVRKVGVEPVDELGTGQDPDALRHLVEHSAAVGTLDQRHYRNLARALELEQLAVGDIVSRTAGLSTVDADAGASEIQTQSRLTHHQRIVVQDENRAVVGVVHVRDTLRAKPGSAAGDAFVSARRCRAAA
jgi:CBS domain containing-hemolysin-like protein